MKKTRKTLRLDKDQAATLKRESEESGLSESQVINLLLIERGRETEPLTPAQKQLQHEIDQLEARKGMLAAAQNKELYQSNWRARGARSVRHLESKPTEAQREQERKEVEAKSLLRQGRTLYEVDRATGLGQKRLMELSRERHAEDEAATRAALDERDRLLSNGPSIPRDELARRITKLRGGEDPEDEEPEQRYSSLQELNVEPIQRRIY